MCCLAEFIVKYVLIIANILFALAGLAILGLGVAVHVNLKDVYELVPGALYGLSVTIIVVGCVVFVISYCACCGAMRESRFMLITYSIFMTILAAIKIAMTVIIFNFLGAALTTVSEWLTDAFAKESMSDSYSALEVLFQCCGTVGPQSYVALGRPIPATCCSLPETIPTEASQCTILNANPGCIFQVNDYFETFGEAIGGVLIAVIIVELVCVIFGVFLSCQIKRKRYA